MLKEMGHRLAPHIIIGHHFGEIRGEWKALEMVTRVGVETIVLVVLKPLPPIKTDQMKIPKPEETSRISAVARILNPGHSDPNGLHPAGPSLEREDGEGMHRFRRQHDRLPPSGDDRIRKRNRPRNKIRRNVLQPYLMDKRDRVWGGVEDR